MPEDVYRGISLPPDLVGSNPFCQPEWDLTEDAFSLAGKDYYSEPYGTPGKATQDDDTMSGALNDFDVCFPDSIRPPAAKLLPAMSFRLWAESPAAVAQRLYNFLRIEPGKIIKVSPGKFAVKADILQTINGCLIPCRLKVRIYCDEEDAKRLVVSFCKRSGDVLAFQKAVSRVLHDLTLEFAAAQEIAEDVLASSELLSPPELPEAPTEPMLLPLLDMLQDDGSPSAPARCAEALAALTALATTNSAGAVSVRAALGQLQWLNLLKHFASSSQVEIAYPAKRLETILHAESHDGPTWGMAC
eukprot:TRINITY_DN23624_c0_g1_i1.p1 TRINITY_DN23624_c0_g1~~TRINITY_DN23624_c0_g1_i1.p1  ORF type:complete len:335 (+),score=72.19 TRINITY_DN23624_c0_g1_i1:100-1005(+)